MIDKSFGICAVWKQTPDVGARDVAELRIVSGNQVLTRLVDVATEAMRDYFRTSAVSFALWLADNWWRLRWEPFLGKRPSADWRLRHELTSAGSGAAWPPIMIYGTGPRVVLAPAFGARPTTGPIRYLELETVHVLPGNHFEEELDRFFEQVLGSCAQAQDGTVLAGLVSELAAERADADAAAWRRLEARLGFDPDCAPEGLIEGMTALGSSLGENGIEEAALSAPGEASAKFLKKAVAASRASELTVALSVAESVSREIFETPAPAWKWGEDAAWQVRNRLGVSADRFDTDAMAEMLDVSWEKLTAASATASRLPYAALLRERDQHAKLALQTRAAVDRRFEFARIVADAIWISGESLGVISRAKTERQKFQRGFAQNLLCPFSEVRRYVDIEAPTDEQIDEAARHFHVHRNVVETLLVNKNVLPRETLLERLEAA
ncbi:MAG: hypothetical protein K2Y56_22800 [Methylobacterium sp.]|uniref:hypothetical protein n=1 Tax=Methylobacterium sp. TaxID=409 RepID=UPI0025DE8318|nr:hypothetical protein [Methylobacterium sp.]MBX9934309.1 hypothetical protein [Methylobacterium sp.]